MRALLGATLERATLRWRRSCARRGHDWLMEERGHSEFVPVLDACLRCGERRVIPPWGLCMCGAPYAEHELEGPLPEARCPDDSGTWR